MEVVQGPRLLLLAVDKVPIEESPKKERWWDDEGGARGGGGVDRKASTGPIQVSVRSSVSALTKQESTASSAVAPRRVLILLAIIMIIIMVNSVGRPLCW